MAPQERESYPPAYEDVEGSSNNHLTPLLDKPAGVSEQATDHTIVELDTAIPSGSGRSASENQPPITLRGSNFVYIDTQEDLTGNLLIDTDLSALPGRFSKQGEEDTAENAFLKVSNGAVIGLRVYVRGSSPAKITVVTRNASNKALPHSIELVPLRPDGNESQPIRLALERKGTSEFELDNRTQADILNYLTVILPTSPNDYNTAIFGPCTTTPALTSRLTCIMRDDNDLSNIKHILGEVKPVSDSSLAPEAVASSSARSPRASWWSFFQQQEQQPEVVAFNAIRIDKSFGRKGCLITTSHEWHASGGRIRAIKAKRTATLTRFAVIAAASIVIMTLVGAAASR